MLRADVEGAAAHPSLCGRARALLFAAEAHSAVVVVPAACLSLAESLPALLVTAGWAGAGKCVAVSVPGKGLADACASRLAAAQRSRVGDAVGLVAAYERILRPGTTSVAYFSDEALAREMMSDPLLRAYSAVVVAGADERTATTDALMALLRKVQRRRHDLRVFVVAAPQHAARLAAFFDLRPARGAPALPAHAGTEPPAASMCAATVALEADPHPVRIAFAAEPVADYATAAAEAVLSIHLNEGPQGDVLVFVPTASAVGEVAEAIEEELARGGGMRANGTKLQVHRLHGAMAASSQAEALRPASYGTRKVIVATEAAESVAIDGVCFVVDAGLQMETLHNVDDGVTRHAVTAISKARAERRAALAGGQRPGRAARLYTEAYYAGMAADGVVEAQRCDLGALVLRLKGLGVENVARFDWPAAPPAAHLAGALEHLHALGALDDAARLTPLGERMATMPCGSVALAKSMAVAGDMHCEEEIAAVAGCLAVHSLWYHGAKEEELEESLKAFAAAEGDFITYLNVMTAYIKGGRRSAICKEYFLDARSLARADAARAVAFQIMVHSRGASSASVSGASAGSADADTVCRAIAAGFFANAATRDTDTDGFSRSSRDVYITARAGTRAELHRRSALRLAAPHHMVCADLSEAEDGRVVMRHCCKVEVAWLKEACPAYFIDDRRPEEAPVTYLAKRQKTKERFKRRGL